MGRAIVLNRLELISLQTKRPPRCLLAAGFAFGKSGDQARFAKDQIGSQKPKDPQGKPAGFIGTVRLELWLWLRPSQLSFESRMF